MPKPDYSSNRFFHGAITFDEKAYLESKLNEIIVSIDELQDKINDLTNKSHFIEDRLENVKIEGIFGED